MCLIENCIEPLIARKLCRVHYHQWLRRKNNREIFANLNVPQSKRPDVRHDDELTRRLKKILCNIRHRCRNPKRVDFKFYGGKGIKNFLTVDDLRALWHRDNAESMKIPSIDRKSSSGDYVFENCQFIEMEQNRVKREYKKKQRTLAEIIERRKRRTLYARNYRASKRNLLI